MKSGSAAGLKKALAADGAASSSDSWCDISGLLIARDRLEAIESDVESGAISSMGSLLARFTEAHAGYDRDAYACWARLYKARFGTAPSELDSTALAKLADNYLAARGKFIKMVLSDAEKEYGAQSRIGFGLDGGEAEREADFAAVRGTFEKDKFVKSMQAELQELTDRVAAFKGKLG